MKIAVLFDQFGPYHHARLRAAGHIHSIVGIEFFENSADYAWGKVGGKDDFSRTTLFPQQRRAQVISSQLRDCLRRELQTVKPDVVAIPGWSSPGALSALEWCVETATASVLLSESFSPGERRVWWKEAIKRRLLRLFGAALVGGRLHRDHLVSLGFDPGFVCRGYDVIDNDYFSRGAAEARSQQSAVKAKYGLPVNYFLASARFVAVKNLVRLIQAYARYRQSAEDRRKKVEDGGRKAEGGPWDLVVLGDGPLRADLSRLISDLQLQSSVLLPGFKSYEELPAYYAFAGAFVLPSVFEPWGLVVNEAMACGLPVLVSKHCGCAPDLVRESVNGFMFNPLDVEQLANLMLKIYAIDFPRSVFGDASHQIVSQSSPRTFADGLAEAAQKSLKVTLRKMNVLDRGLIHALIRRPVADGVFAG